MKKTGILFLFALVAAFGAPSFAAALSLSCPYPCISGSGSLSGQCVASDGVSACSASIFGGGANQEWAIYYRDTIVWFVNYVLVPILMAIAFIVFLWGVYKYFIQGATDEKSRADGRQFVLWGVLGFVIITSLWGVVNIVKDTIIPSTVNETRPNYPTL